MNAPESLDSGPRRVLRDRIGRMQKRDEPIKLDTEDFAQVLLVSGEKTPWTLVAIFELQHQFPPDAWSRTGQSHSRLDKET
jgi:hypothetical protein